MSLDNLIIFPAVGVLIVIWLAAMIRLNFKSGAAFRPSNNKLQRTDGRLQAMYIPNRSLPLLVTVGALLGYGAWQITSISGGYISTYKPFYVISGSLLMFQLLVVAFSRPFVAHDARAIRQFKTCVLLPFYNESPTSLQDGLASFFDQTIVPTEIHVVDDGSKQSYTDIETWFYAQTKRRGIRASWQRQSNAGKRAAQARAMSMVTPSDDTIIVTVDSDGMLDPHAIEEGLKPFLDSRVQSVAGIIIAKNAQENVLARITDLLFVSAQQRIHVAFRRGFSKQRGTSILPLIRYHNLVGARLHLRDIYEASCAIL